jgi:hypothetical protein
MKPKISIQPAMEYVREAMKCCEKANSISYPPLLRVDLIDLDNCLEKFLPRNVYVSPLGTDFTVKLAHQIVFESAKHTIIYSKNPTELITKIIVLETKISYSQMSNGYFSQTDWCKITSVAQKIADSPLYINDTVIDEAQLSYFVNKLELENKSLPLVIIDDDIKITETLQDLAEVVNIAIVVVVEGNIGSRPPTIKHDRYKFYQSLADAGDMDAHYNLGEMYEQGYQVEYNADTAKEHYKLATKHASEPIKKKAKEALKRLEQL